MVQMRIIITFLVLQLPCLSYGQKIDSINHEIKLLQLRIDSLHSEMVKLKEIAYENQLSKNYFNTIIGSQLNIFSLILTGVLGVIGIVIAFLGFPFLEHLFKDIPDLRATQQKVEKELPTIQQSLKSLQFNSDRALYVAHLTRKNFEWCTILALRCMSFFTKVNDQEGELEWLNNAINCFKEATESQRQIFIKRSKEEATEKLNAILIKEYPEGSQNSEKAKTFINELSAFVT